VKRFDPTCIGSSSAWAAPVVSARPATAPTHQVRFSSCVIRPEDHDIVV